MTVLRCMAYLCSPSCLSFLYSYTLYSLSTPSILTLSIPSLHPLFLHSLFPLYTLYTLYSLSTPSTPSTPSIPSLHPLHPLLPLFPAQIHRCRRTLYQQGGRQRRGGRGRKNGWIRDGEERYRRYRSRCRYGYGKGTGNWGFPGSQFVAAAVSQNERCFVRGRGRLRFGIFSSIEYTGCRGK
jgi:hypothetical protein